MPDVVGFSDKIARICELNYANGRNAPKNKTELSEWLGVGAGTLSSRYKVSTANLHVSLERAIVMALGFGPSDAQLESGLERAWSGWTKEWGEPWRAGEPQEFVKKFEESGYFISRPPDDAHLAELMPKIRKERKPVRDQGSMLSSPTRQAISVARTSDRYLDRLASLQVTCVRAGPDDTLVATCTFGTVEVDTGDAAYLVSINRCHAELLLRQGSFAPRLENATIKSRSEPVREMTTKREWSKFNHPSWLLADPRPKTPLQGEYDGIVLGVVQGEISPDDEANLVVNKAGFAVSAVGGLDLEEGGILNSLLRACPQLEDSQADYRVIHRQSADSELTDAPLRPSGRSMGQDQEYFART